MGSLPEKEQLIWRKTIPFGRKGLLLCERSIKNKLTNVGFFSAKGEFLKFDDADV